MEVIKIGLIYLNSDLITSCVDNPSIEEVRVFFSTGQSYLFSGTERLTVIDMLESKLPGQPLVEPIVE